jgi:hypothetical protein
MQKVRVGMGTNSNVKKTLPSPNRGSPAPIPPKRIAQAERRLRETADYFPPQSFQASTYIRLVLVPLPLPLSSSFNPSSCRGDLLFDITARDPDAAAGARNLCILGARPA